MNRSDLDPTSPSANERLREGWRKLLRGSTAFAALAHVGLLMVTIGWEVPYFTRPEPDESRLLLLPGWGETAVMGAGIGARDSVPADLTEVADAEDAGLSTGPVVVDAEAGDMWDAVGERLRGRGAPLPTVAEMQVEPEPEEETDEVAQDAAAGQDESGPSIGGDTRAIELAELPEPDSLSLDRLSSLRPQLAFMTASAWVLIRNQAEVEAFLRRGYRSGRLDPAATGSVSVTLWIDRRGSVEWAEISRSSGRTDLDEFTLALFNEVVAFRAARERGVYISRSVTFSVNYPW